MGRQKSDGRPLASTSFRRTSFDPAMNSKLSPSSRRTRISPSRQFLPWSFSVMTTSSPGRSTSGKLRMFSISV